MLMATYLPPGPKAYGLDKNAEMTVLFYERMKIRDKFVYAPEKFEAKDADAIIKRLHEALPAKKKVE